MIKVIALDLDGTLVNEALAISPMTKAVLKRAQDKGVHVVIATGRMFPSTFPFAEELNVQGPVVSYQGAMIRDISQPVDHILDHPILFHQGIDLGTARGIIDYIHAESIHANVYVDDQLFTTAYNPSAIFYQKISGVQPIEVNQFHDILTGNPSKIMIIDDRCDAIIETLKPQFASSVSICKSRHNFCEIVHHSVSKWEAIRFLLEKWSISPDEVMAIGDQENDLSMICGAGIGVAMGNAPDHVKAQANHVTLTIDEDGAAHAIERFVFQSLPVTDSEELPLG